MNDDQIAQLPVGQKKFMFGKGESVDGIVPDKVRIDPETILVLDEIEEGKIARFTLINNLWTEVASLEEEQEASLGHVTVEIVKIEKEKVTFLLK